MKRKESIYNNNNNYYYNFSVNTIFESTINPKQQLEYSNNRNSNSNIRSRHTYTIIERIKGKEESFFTYINNNKQLQYN